MAIVVVGGEGRKVGKTSLVCQIICAMPERQWTAIKVAGEGHLHDSKPGGDTERFLLAGARRAILLQGDDRIQALMGVLVEGGNFLIESTGSASAVRADLRLLVLGVGKPEKPGVGSFCADARVREGRVENGGDAIHYVRTRLSNVS